MPDTILVVDDEPNIRAVCEVALQSEGYEVRQAGAATEALTLLEAGDIDIVVTDLKMPGMTGLELLRAVRRDYSGVDVILMTGHATVATAVEALKEGAYDYVTKPFSIDDFTNRVNRLAERRELVADNRILQARLNAAGAPGRLIGTSAAMRAVHRQILRVASRTQPVLITGESGTGKELTACAIHEHGPNSNERFVPVDCGALNAGLIESELFGHLPGAFTGATQRRIGLLASAGKGTVFLDEIGELPMDLQSRLLRTIQERECRPIGSNKAERFEARIVAATNRDLESAVKEGKFRSDLYYRLNVLTIHLPPLRERKGDIAALAQSLIDADHESGGRVSGISRGALTQLMNYPWPGNVRELQNHVERALSVSEGSLIHAEDLAPELRSCRSDCNSNGAKLGYLEEIERKAIVEVMEAAGGHKLNAAKLLGVSRTTLYKKLKDYGLETTEA